MSGLTLAIFSLDLTSLRVLEVAGSERDKRYASRIMPLAQRQYLVLVSLVLANALAVETMPLIIDRISTPLIAILVSVTAVLIFGEVLPQAVCGRYGLIIGYLFSWLVWVIIGAEFVVAYPLSKLLEYMLGKNYGTYYRRAELKALVDFHGPGKLASKMPTNKTPVAIEEARAIGDEQLTIDEVLIIKGALELTTKRALSAMVKLEDVFMISVHDNIDRKLLLELILVDPNQVTPVKELTEDKRYFYPVFWIDGDMPLYILLNKFQEGASTHMAFVREKKPDGTYVPSGVVTLEDVLEEILQEEIYDEIDAFRGVAKRIQLARAHALRAISSAGNSHGKISANNNNNRTARKIPKDNRPPNPKVPRLIGAPPKSQEGSGQSSVTESRRLSSPQAATVKKVKNVVKPHHRHHHKNPKTQDVHANVSSIAPKAP
uniref:CNNM transmembrane domain-containing protein n=1 Tax=Romanomermis culicivorax TaxID=13658 RepID=A0A915JHC3_ROMCU